jgi:hypothetical protein
MRWKSDAVRTNSHHLDAPLYAPLYFIDEGVHGGYILFKSNLEENSRVRLGKYQKLHLAKIAAEEDIAPRIIITDR